MSPPRQDAPGTFVPAFSGWKRTPKAGRIGVAALLVLLMSLAAGAGSRAEADPAADIRAALEQWRLDFNARRAAHICDLFASGLRYDFQGLPEQNTTQLCARLHRALADPTKSFHYDLRIKEIIVSGSLAMVRLTWVSTVTGPYGQSTTNDEQGLDVFRHQTDGSWKIIRYIAYPEER